MSVSEIIAEPIKVCKTIRGREASSARSMR